MVVTTRAKANSKAKFELLAKNYACPDSQRKLHWEEMRCKAVLADELAELNAKFELLAKHFQRPDSQRELHWEEMCCKVKDLVDEFAELNLKKGDNDADGSVKESDTDGGSGATESNAFSSIEDETRVVADDDERKWKLDDFEIIQLLGQGGQASVLKARHKATGHIVAIKKIPVDTQCHWKDELDNHEKLDHPGIVHMFGHFFERCEAKIPGDHEAFLYLILEFCPDGTLGDMLQGDGAVFKEHEAAGYIVDIVESVQHMHSRGMIHRDIKHPNVLLKEGHAVLADLGISVDDSLGNRRVSYTGTPGYMAPEIGTHANIYGKPVDVWGLGVLLFAMLVGKLPYPRELTDFSAVSFRDSDFQSDCDSQREDDDEPNLLGPDSLDSYRDYDSPRDEDELEALQALLACLHEPLPLDTSLQEPYSYFALSGRPFATRRGFIFFSKNGATFKRDSNSNLKR